MCSNFLVLVTSHAAVFITPCSIFRQFHRQTIEQAIAIMKSRCGISIDSSFGWFIRQISTVVGELPDLKKGFLNSMVNMGHHGIIRVHNKTQVSDSFGRRYAICSGRVNIASETIITWPWRALWHPLYCRIFTTLRYIPYLIYVVQLC